MPLSIPRGSPPPAYTRSPQPPIQAPASEINPTPATASHADLPEFFPSSPGLEDLEIQVFGTPLAALHRSPSPTGSFEDLELLATSTAIPPSQSEPPRPDTLPPAPPVPPARRGRPRKVVSDSPGPLASQISDRDAASMTFTIHIHIPQPPKKIRAGNRTKIEKQEPKVFGPINGVSTLVTWRQLIQLITQTLDVREDQISTDSMTYRFLSPKNSPTMLLTSPAGLLSLQDQVKPRAYKNNGSAHVIVEVDPPKVPVFTGTRRERPVDEDNHSGEDEPLQRPVKKGKLDAAVYAIADELEVKYHGACELHPGTICFHHRPTGTHFDLDRTRRLAWASAIHIDKASRTQIPLGSHHFKVDVTSKPKSQPRASSSTSAPTVTPPASIAAPVAPSTPTPGPSFPYSPSGYPSPYPGLPPMTPMSFHSPHYYHHMANPQWPPAPPHPAIPHPQFSATPSSAPPPDPKVDAFCQAAGISAEDKARLAGLGFQIGDDLDHLPEFAYKSAGFRPLGWIRIVDAYKKYRIEHPDA
ncbi:hypothetical protein BDN72DRAFT_844354 [Pluteus cervinus]|uniref:Uncharacterized protein n=1 Tax=Pluteus cervinus TaxID=181527 RepID=A0ACD3AM51_9AGAR|nr:hypothetical protein BDN72DRAFT_844354 [Pluteus cervinus]